MDSSLALYQTLPVSPHCFTGLTGGSDLESIGKKRLVRHTSTIFGLFNLHLHLEDIFRALRFIPRGHAIPLYRPPVNSKVSSNSSQSPYKIFFHAYKPSAPFRKTAPPAPDFYIVVVE